MAKDMVIDGITYRIPDPNSIYDTIFLTADDCYHRPILEFLKCEAKDPTACARMDCRYTIDEDHWIKEGEVIFVETGEFAE